jgi:hypothetical protein
VWQWKTMCFLSFSFTRFQCWMAEGSMLLLNSCHLLLKRWLNLGGKWGDRCEAIAFWRPLWKESCQSPQSPVQMVPHCGPRCQGHCPVLRYRESAPYTSRVTWLCEMPHASIHFTNYVTSP